jgi:AraC-like DNA-binding protein
MMRGVCRFPARRAIGLNERSQSRRERIRRQLDLRSSSDEIRIGPAIPVRELLLEFGVDPAPVLARAGVDPVLLEDPDSRVGFDVMGRLMNEAVAATGCPHLGLLLGQRFSPATIGPVFQLMKHSRRVRDALRALVLRLHVHDRGGAPSLSHAGPNELALAYGIYHRGDYNLAPIYDVAIAIVQSFMRDLCGPRWKPLRVTFPYRRPANLAPYRRLFGAPLVFDAEQASVVMSERWLDAPVPGADPAVRAALEQLILEKEAAEALPFAHRVRRVLRSLVLSGSASAEHLAFMFATSRRSLHRALAAEGTSLQLLVNETRFEVARQLLGESDMPAGEIAAALHYSDSSAFSRAFKEWSGTSPREWRQAIRSRGPAT